MRRRDLVAHLRRHGCALHREGANHSIFVKRPERTSTAVPRHREISDILVRKICRELGIPDPFAQA